MKTRLPRALAVTLSVVFSTLGTSPAIAAPNPILDTASTSQVVVRFAGAVMSATTLSDAVDAEVSYEGAVGVRTRVYEVAGLTGSEELAGALRDLEALPGVISAEQDKTVLPMTTPDDPLLPDQWGLTGSFGIGAPGAWDFADGAGARVAVIDTGIVAHSDIDANVTVGYDFITDSDTANDGDGRDADPTDPGDWQTKEFCGGTSTSSWHGTHVSGIIAAVGNNGVGVSGVAPKATIVPVRALGRCGGSMSDVLAGARWAAGLSVPGVPANQNPVRIINMSLGSAGACPSWMQAAINEIAAVGVLIVVAAGNSNANAANYSPASCDNVFTVAATTSLGERASFSNYGSVVDIAAPGSLILNTINLGATSAAAAGYSYMSGTSMATPHVAGVAALVLGLQPTLSLSDLRARLTATATAFASPTACATCGAGIVSAAGAITAAVVTKVPAAPTGVTATSTASGVSIAWAAPTFTGTSAVTGYTVLGGQGCTTTALLCEVTGLTPGTSYEFSVRARNTTGLGFTSTKASAVFITVPDAPQNVTSVITDELTALVSWMPPAIDNGAPVLKYIVVGQPNGTCETALYSCTFNDLTPGAAYTFSVAAINSAGAGLVSTSESLQMAAGPAAPTGLSVEVSGRTMLARWTQGYGGLSTTGYTIVVSPGGKGCVTSETLCLVSDLEYGTQYSFSLKAQGARATTSAIVTANAATGADPAPPTTLNPAPSVPTTSVPLNPVPELPTTTAPAVSAPSAPGTSLPVSTLTVRRSSSTRLSKVLTVPAKARAKWSVTGGCRIKGTSLVARSTAGICVVTLKSTLRGKTTTRTKIVSVR